MPEGYDSYSGLAYTYVRMERYEESLATFMKAIDLAPDVSFNYYNVACYYAIQGITDEAFEWLKTALDKGFDYFEHLRTDPDIAILRESEEFEKLIKKYEGKK